MSQKYPSNKAPYESQVVAASLWLCCVDKNGRRKKAYATRKDAKVVASKLHGKIYRCLFNSEMYHVTTQTKGKTNRLVIEYQIEGLKERLEKVKAKMEILKETVEQMNGDTPLEEIKAANSQWNELCNHKEGIQKSLKNKKTTLRRLLKA